MRDLIFEATRLPPEHQQSTEQKILHLFWVQGVLAELLAYAAKDLVEVEQHLEYIKSRNRANIANRDNSNI